MMIRPQQLTNTFQSNHRLATHLVSGINHDESLYTAGFQINPVNWVLGHIINGRNEALRYLGKPAIWGDRPEGLYATGSQALPDEMALTLESLLGVFDEAQADLEMALAEVSEEYLAEIVETRFGDLPRWQHISGLAWHETYHIGQFELLRQMIHEAREKAGAG